MNSLEQFDKALAELQDDFQTVKELHSTMFYKLKSIGDNLQNLSKAREKMEAERQQAIAEAGQNNQQ